MKQIRKDFYKQLQRMTGLQDLPFDIVENAVVTVGDVKALKKAIDEFEKSQEAMKVAIARALDRVSTRKEDLS